MPGGATRLLTIAAFVGLGVTSAAVLGMVALYVEDIVDEVRHSIASARAAR